ncbi:pyridoxamine 5'-phosphate oxidase family protein [Nocardioides limicola]|uniref:pyridoxamine 5'-phosphate oxidase family protein n=1 Tax=Nocardioides limicola TaxID=2803368 RepID=UPI00193AF1B7|nr:TIGR03618 family F420-dependent PPOX class oxidoreductase [Nocardioides sp. DJM-14]
MTRRTFTLTDPAYVEFWRERRHCTVTTQRPDGSLHVTPMGVVLEPEANAAWALTSRNSVKARNIRAVQPAWVAVGQVEGRWWASLEGTAEIVEDPDQVAAACARYAERYRTPRPNPDRVAVRISVTRTLGNLP